MPKKEVLAQRWPWLVAAGIALAVLFFSIVRIELPGDHDWDDRPRGGVADIQALRARDDVNVLFILIDTLRAERLGAWGYERDTSPTLDRLAHGGVRFARQLSQSSWTKASMASLWTGLYPRHTGISRYDDVIPDQALMASEVFRDAGFQTVGLYRNGWVAPTFGFDQGFEVYRRPAARPLPPNVRREKPTVSDKSTDEGVFEAAAEFLRVNGNKRWFLYLHLMDLHEYIYDENSALFGSGYSDIYDNSIRWTDDSLAILLHRLAELGHLDDTVIAVAADHGEAFLERGFEGHARRVYRETTEVPFLVSFPFRLDPGIVVESRTQNVDIWPTLLDLLGLPVPTKIDGRSRVPEILASAAGAPPSDEETIAISDLDQTWARRDDPPLPTVAVVEGTHRYVRVELQQHETVEQLFDAADDPKEFRDLAKQDPETLARLRAKADEYEQQRPEWGDAPTREIGELELNLLRALGYAIEK